MVFIEMIINCTAGTEHKSQKMEFVVAAAEVFGVARFDIRRVTGCDKWWFPILSGCWPEVGLNRFK